MAESGAWAGGLTTGVPLSSDLWLLRIRSLAAATASMFVAPATALLWGTRGGWGVTDWQTACMADCPPCRQVVDVSP
jgi:hypothetical protein